MIAAACKRYSRCAAYRQRETRRDRKRPVCTDYLKSGMLCQYIMSYQTPGLHPGDGAKLDRPFNESLFLKIIIRYDVGMLYTSPLCR